VLVVRPVSRINGSSFSQGWPFPPTSSDFYSGKADNPSIGQVTFLELLPSDFQCQRKLGGERLVAYQFVTTCANCAKQFGVLWVMDSTRIRPESVARITCPLCRRSFDQPAKELLPIGSQIQNLIVGRPVRSVEVDYDCPYCRNRGIAILLLHTDLSWDELSKEHVQNATCNNSLCPLRGLLQKVKPSRVLLGSLNPA
jgi:hypothetical protein